MVNSEHQKLSKAKAQFVAFILLTNNDKRVSKAQKFSPEHVFITVQISVCQEKPVAEVKLDNSCQSVHGERKPLLVRSSLCLKRTYV